VAHWHAWNGGFLAGYGVSILFGIWLFNRQLKTHPAHRLLIASFPITGYTALAVFLREILETPFRDWDAIRLVPAFALAHGSPIYDNPSSGPMLDFLYGPVTALAYWPATVMRNPLSAVLFAKGLTFVYFFVPVLLFLRWDNKRRKRPAVEALFLFIGFCLFTADSLVLSSSAYYNHSDAPVLGLAALGCWVLLDRTKGSRLAAFIMSGVLIALAVWTKQPAIPMLLVLPLYVGLAEGQDAFCQCALAFGVSMSVISALFLCVFHPHDLWYNLVVSPSHHPIPWGIIGGAGRAIREFIWECKWAVLGILFGLLYTVLLEPKTPRSSPRTWLQENGWVLLVMIGCAELPLAIPARMILGGWVNSFSFSYYFWVLALLWMISQRLYQPMVKLAMVLLAVGSVAVLTPDLAYYYLHLADKIANLPNNPQSIAYRYAQCHPGEVYFPWNILSSYMAEGRFYHFGYGFVDRDENGKPVSRIQLQDGLPEHLRWVAFSAQAQDHYVMKYLPQFSHRETLPELPGWTVFSRESE